MYVNLHLCSSTDTYEFILYFPQRLSQKLGPVELTRSCGASVDA